MPADRDLPGVTAARASSGAAVPDLLRRIVERRRERLAEVRASNPGLSIEATPHPPAAHPVPGLEPLTPRDNPFLAALTHHGRSGSPPPAETPRQPAIIAEGKLGSPRLRSPGGRGGPPAQARLSAEHGAAALSVVVEPDFFHGSYELLADCRAASGLPAIAKD